jgi:hypothetical protein
MGSRERPLEGQHADDRTSHRAQHAPEEHVSSTTCHRSTPQSRSIGVHSRLTADEIEAATALAASELEHFGYPVLARPGATVLR